MATFRTLNLASLCAPGPNSGPANAWVDRRWLFALGEGASRDDIETATRQAGLRDLPHRSESFWGVPFAIGSQQANHSEHVGQPPTAESAWLVLGDDLHPSLPRQATINLAPAYSGSQLADQPADLAARAGHVVFCHFADVTPGEHGGMAPTEVGELLGEYTLVLADGRRVTQPIRRRFEVNPYRNSWGQQPFAAVAHRQYESHPEVTAHSPGLYGLIGGPGGADAWLYSLANPSPETPIERIELASTGRGLLVIVGVTLALDLADPLRRSALTALRVDLADETTSSSGTTDAAASAGWAVTASIDAGVIVKTVPLADPRGADWLAEPLIGWGADPLPATLPANTPTYVEATGASSAQLTIHPGPGSPAARLSWSEILENGRAESADGRVRVQVLHPEPTWVHAKVVDRATGRPIAARVHLSGPSGEYLPPYGHPADVNTNWCETLGGDVVLGRTTYAYVPGEFQAELPVGEIYVEVAKGFEYTPIRQKVTISPGQRELVLPIERWTDFRVKGYFNGDTHVHFLNPTASVLEASGEDVHVTNVLTAKWGRLFTDIENFTGGLAPTSTPENLVYVSSENRHHLLGHISLLGLKHPVYPLSSGGPNEDYIGARETTMIADWADAAHEQGALAIAPHFPNPHAELAADIALGKIDAAEIKYLRRDSQEYGLLQWYRYLNCGYRLPAVGGTDKMSNTQPVGGVRTYAYIGTEEPFSYDAWCRAIKAGRTFTSSGPLIELWVDGRMVGDTIDLPAGGGTVEVEARASCAHPLDRLQIVVGGIVVAESSPDASRRHAILKTRVAIDRGTWIAARCAGDLTIHQAWDVDVYAHTSPIYLMVGGRGSFSATDASYMLTLIEGGITYLDKLGVHRDAAQKRHNLSVFEAGRAAIHRRMHEHGVAH